MSVVRNRRLPGPFRIVVVARPLSAPEADPSRVTARDPASLERFDRGEAGEDPIRRCLACGSEVPGRRRLYCDAGCKGRAREGRRRA